MESKVDEIKVNIRSDEEGICYYLNLLRDEREEGVHYKHSFSCIGDL